MGMFFTSDHHFLHRNIIKYVDRPFSCIEEMDAELIRAWNGVVGRDDIVWHLGYFTMGSPDEARRYFGQLNGQINILGNRWHHDKRWLRAFDNGLTDIMSASAERVLILCPMEVITLSGYTDKEKLEIAKNFLIPKLLKEHALDAKQIALSDKMLDKIIECYTKEAGVRQLERVLAKLLRKSIQVLQKEKDVKAVTIDDKKIKEWLGTEKYRRPDRKVEEVVGLATGLAWTEVGGDTLEIEVTVMKGKGSLSLTGQLGEVMQESAQAALSYIRSRSKAFGLKENFYADMDIHVHIPEGAIPKDGPSAGISMCTSIVSALTKRPVYRDIAMTGEITLRGRVLPIGGLKEKILAAHRGGIRKVVIPKENEKDLKDIPQSISKQLDIALVEHMD